MNHDPGCFLPERMEWPCICDRLAAARGDERGKLTDTWKQNLALISTREYERGRGETYERVIGAVTYLYEYVEGPFTITTVLDTIREDRDGTRRQDQD